MFSLLTAPGTLGVAVDRALLRALVGARNVDTTGLCRFALHRNHVPLHVGACVLARAYTGHSYNTYVHSPFLCSGENKTWPARIAEGKLRKEVCIEVLEGATAMHAYAPSA